jgi:hypothetical protein
MPGAQRFGKGLRTTTYPFAPELARSEAPIIETPKDFLSGRPERNPPHKASGSRAESETLGRPTSGCREPYHQTVAFVMSRVNSSEALELHERDACWCVLS